MRQKEFAEIILLTGILVVTLFFLLVFKSKQIKQSLNRVQPTVTISKSVTKISISPTPVISKIISPTVSLINKKQISYFDTVCSIYISYPNFTIMNGVKYIWQVDAGDDKTFIPYVGREQPNSNKLDHSIVVYAQPEGDSSPYYSASADIICTPNNSNLTLEIFAQKVLEHYQNTKDDIYSYPYNKVNKLPLEKLGNIEVIPVDLEYDVHNYIYLSVNKNKLFSISNSNKGSGILAEDAKKIINTLKF